MSVLTFDCPSLATTLELPRPTVETPVCELGLAELTLWLNSEIATQLHAHASVDACQSRALIRAVSKSVLTKIDIATTQQQLRWIVADEMKMVLSFGLGSQDSNSARPQVVPTEVHQAMVHTPLPPLHPIVRIAAWFESLKHAAQVLIGRFAGGFVPESPTS